MPLAISLVGARGRMGRSVAAAVDGADDPAEAFARAEVVVDFSSPLLTRRLIDLAAASGRALVIGTTGHAAEDKPALREAASRIPCVWAGNYSVGVNLLFALTRRAAAVLGSDYDAEVVEMHHRFKKDAPSGTAERLLEILLEERRLDASALRHGRHGITGERTPSEVGIHALRGGDVVGEHTVLFAALGERVELVHKASDRSIFARGALRAAQWLAGRGPGLHDMQDVLGLR
jgi:4-hydroxy-tetrahydrodipicolinate reductase